MPKPLPPLNALRAFDVAARYENFVKAAEELRVSPAAVSQQIKALEDHFGVKLFRRFSRGVELTSAGRFLLPGLADGFERISESVQEMRTWTSRDVVTIRASQSFAAKWLMPRLPQFHEQCPKVDIRVWASTRNRGQVWGDCDLAVRYEPTPYPGAVVELLLEEEAFPVCSPDVALSLGLRTPAALANATLIHDDNMRVIEAYPNWRMWLDKVGACDVDASGGLRFDLSSMAIQAAIDGQGVVLARSVLVKDDIRAGRLVRPFEVSYAPTFSYYLLSASDSRQGGARSLFREWLLGEAARFSAEAV